MAFDWNRFKGDYVTWTEVGQVVEGIVTDVRVGAGFGKEYPELVLQTSDGPQTMSATQTNLQQQLAEYKPGINDRVKVEYVGERPNANPAINATKLFTVTVTHAGTAPAPSQLV